MAKGRGKRAAQAAADAEDKALAKAQSAGTPETRPSDSGARQPDKRSASTRARDATPGAEYATSSGPQEVGPTRGSVRPTTEVLPGSRSPVQPNVIVPTAADEELAKRREKAVAQYKKDTDPKAPKKLVKVVATRAGFYNDKLQHAGDQFFVSVPEGKTVEQHGTWFETVEDRAAEVAAATGKTASPKAAASEPKTGDEVL